jgi:hypothetical protein
MFGIEDILKNLGQSAGAAAMGPSAAMMDAGAGAAGGFMGGDAMGGQAPGAALPWDAQAVGGYDPLKADTLGGALSSAGSNFQGNLKKTPGALGDAAKTAASPFSEAPSGGAPPVAGPSAAQPQATAQAIAQFNQPVSVSGLSGPQKRKKLHAPFAAA